MSMGKRKGSIAYFIKEENFLKKRLLLIVFGMWL